MARRAERDECPAERQEDAVDEFAAAAGRLREALDVGNDRQPRIADRGADMAEQRVEVARELIGERLPFALQPAQFVAGDIIHELGVEDVAAVERTATVVENRERPMGTIDVTRCDDRDFALVRNE